MRIVGVEFAGSEMRYVVLEGSPPTSTVLGHNRLLIGSAREPNDLRAFKLALETMFGETTPNRVAIKKMPENGRFRAGPPAMKMEGLVLATCPCEVTFVTSPQLKKAIPPSGLPKYLETAAKVAIAAA